MTVILSLKRNIENTYKYNVFILTTELVQFLINIKCVLLCKP